MAAIRDRRVVEAAARDRYSSLYRHLLAVRPEPEWLTSFGEPEAIPGYRLPDSARSHRPLRSISRMNIVHGQSLARQAAEWFAPKADVEAETTGYVYWLISPVSIGAPVRQRRFSIGEILPPHDSGPWPEGFTVSREQIYDDMGRLTGGPEDVSGNNR